MTHEHEPDAPSEQSSSRPDAPSAKHRPVRLDKPRGASLAEQPTLAGDGPPPAPAAPPVPQAPEPPPGQAASAPAHRAPMPGYGPPHAVPPHAGAPYSDGAPYAGGAPYGPQPGQGAYPQGGYAASGPAAHGWPAPAVHGHPGWAGPPPPAGGVGTAAMVVGIISGVLALTVYGLVLSLVLGPIALGLGISARRQVARARAAGAVQGDNSGLATAGFVLGIVTTAISWLLLVVVLIAVANT
ncbi:hypothetical protein [Streptomyces sp. XM4193]|uniref:hypothetical protein n=1 Tax=Streptomyces sp. XM4193 TaxID=2929782 RepID=UPI0024A65CE1|nr:hypothetical protein [Streptomyces sp. XM4193]